MDWGLRWMQVYWLSSYRITACAWVDSKGIIVCGQTAPIFIKFVGQPLSNLVRWMENQGGFQYVLLSSGWKTIVTDDATMKRWREAEDAEKRIKDDLAKLVHLGYGSAADEICLIFQHIRDGKLLCGETDIFNSYQIDRKEVNYVERDSVQ